MRLRTSRNLLRNAIFVLGTIVVGGGLLSCAAHAVSPSPTPTVSPDTASGLEISPATIDLSGSKGGSYIIQLRLRNTTKNTLTYTPSVSDFGAKDESGIPKLLPAGDLPPTASIVSWVQPLNPVMLQPSETRSININIIIPDSAEAGGHYGVVNFTGSDPEIQGNSVGVRASTGLLILAKVAGAIDENLTTASFTTENSSGKQMGLFDSGPITFLVRLHNTGNIHLQPSGTIAVSDMFGRSMGIIPVNSAKGNVLPNSIRRFESTFAHDGLFGRYTADLTIGYGSKGQVLQGEIIFWVIPWKIVGTVVVVLVTLGFVARQLLKSYNKRIIKKYKQSNDKQTKKPKKRKD